MDGARHGWDASPISLARLAAELWPLIGMKIGLSFPRKASSGLARPLWDFSKHHHYIGGQGAGGMGYGRSGLGGRGTGKPEIRPLSINIQTDGDMNYAPGVLWTAAHHKIPLLTIMHNNRGYHQEVMFMQRMAASQSRRGKCAHRHAPDRSRISTTRPMAKAYGMYRRWADHRSRGSGAGLKRGIDV